MPPPQWKEPPGLFNSWGFDRNATPPWFTVGHRETKELLLDFAIGMSVRSVNPGIVAITDRGLDGLSRIFHIEGKNPISFPARIEIRDPKTKSLSVLEVNVKGQNTHRISFHFVEDRAGDKTIRQPDIVDGLIDDLNSIYQLQTSLTFELWGVAPVKVNFDLGDVVMEARDAQSKDLTGEGNIVGKSIWRDIFARNSDRSGLNIYFVPSDDPINNRNAIAFVDGDNCVIEDGREPLDMILPHAVGRLLNCPVTLDPNNIQQLMFFNESLRRTGNFIPKDCANIMNP